ncbi:MAG: hypothetical protein J6C82_03565 [Clostridia bacterium]|nr:hypothetical protein [Clostridia bacterium]
MTKEDLMQVYYIDKEITAWKNELERIKNSVQVSGIRYSGMPKRKGQLDDKVAELAVSIAETERKISQKLLELEKAKSEVTSYILNIDDCQTRLIFKLRCINLMSWNAVADEIGGMNSEYSVKKRFYRYLEKCG